MNNVIFLQEKIPNVEQAFLDLIVRWSRYQKAYKQSSKGKLFNLYTSKNLPKEMKVILRKYSIPELISLETNPIHKIFLAGKLIRESESKTLLVCGDNQISILTAIIFKIIAPRKVLIQTQFHGDTYSRIRNKGLRGLLRIIFARLAFKISTSIRVVSEFQIEEIRAISRNIGAEFVVAPIPIDFDKIAEFSDKPDIDILFVGRLHEERGLVELVEIIQILTRIERSLNIAIVGEGPLLRFTQSQLSNLENGSEVNFLGHLNNRELKDVYSRSRILLSCAVTEGYGLTLREAALSSIHVIAKQSKGAIEAQKNFENTIDLYNSVLEATDLIKTQLEKNRVPIDRTIKLMQEKKDWESLNRLFSSWEST